MDLKVLAAATVLTTRVKQCWAHEFEWDVIPTKLKDGVSQIGRAICIPPIAVLAGLLVTVGFCMSHSEVVVEGTEWVEPVLLWIVICMPTGSGKSGLCKLLKSLIERARKNCGLTDCDPSWWLDDQTLEKMGALMAENHCKLLGLYDELAMFLAQMKILQGKGSLSDSHEMAVFLHLYGGSAWVRRTVSGDAKFRMQHTGMTLGGFTQPSVACSLIELQSNVDKGLCQRFLWLVPPSMQRSSTFDQLQRVDANFMSDIGTLLFLVYVSVIAASLMSSLWVSERTVHKWVLPRRPVHTSDEGDGEELQEMACGHFQKKYDKVQGILQDIGCMDELLSGMMSKSKGQVLRVAAVMHVLFHMETPAAIPQEISEEAIKAADLFVDFCIQHAAFLGGRGKVEDAIADIQDASKTALPSSAIQDKAVASYTLLLPGKVINLSELLAAKNFRGKGNKTGAVRAMTSLAEAGLGKLIEQKAQRGTAMVHTYKFEKVDVPNDPDKKMELMEKLVTYGVSLQKLNVPKTECCVRHARRTS